MSSSKKSVAATGQALLDRDEQVRAIALKKAQEKYAQNPTEANRKAYESAQAAWREVSGQEDGAPRRPLTSVAEVLDYLEKAGRKVKKTKLYEDIKKGILPRKVVDSKAVFRPVDVDRYATTLPLAVVPERQQQEVEDLARVKLAAEIDKLRAQRETIEFDRQIKAGKYVLRMDVALELAARASELDRALRSTFRLFVADFIRLCGGDGTKDETVATEFEKILDAALTEFSRPVAFATEVFDSDSKNENGTTESQPAAS